MNEQTRLDEKEKIKIEIDQTKSELNSITDYQSNTLEWMNANYISFFDKLSIASSAIITASFALLSTIYKENNAIISQYSYLFIIGLAFLILTFIFGIFYRFIFVETKQNIINAKIGEKFINNMKSIQKGIDKGLVIEVDGDSDFTEEYITQVTPTMLKHQKMYKFFNILRKIIEFICPIFFIIGLLLVISYFMIQLFDF